LALYSSFLRRVDALKWQLYSFRLPLVTEGYREGLAIRLESANDVRWGEISPLPGRSGENKEQALSQLLYFLNGQERAERLLPSVRFGLESALSAPVHITAPLYALLSASTPEKIIQQADEAAKRGFSTIKFKAAPFPTKVGKELLNFLQKRFRLRVDCNQAFSFEEALFLLSDVEMTRLDYIEDPTFETEKLAEFPYPFAIDEKVAAWRTLPLSTYRNLYGFILKPTILGGQAGCAPLINYAHHRKLKVIFSSAIESGLGLTQILLLAHKYNLLSEPLGLDTHRYLQRDIVKIPLDFTTPLVRLNTNLPINEDNLQEIDHGYCELPHL
jgi:O-succinylbenzoate synthase